MGNTSKLRGNAEIKGRNEIIAELYQSREFRDTISKMNPANLRDELKQEVMLILCEKDEDEIISIYNSGGLKYYTVRIILNLIQSNTSPFYKKFRSIPSYDLTVLRDMTSYDAVSDLIDNADVSNTELSKYALRHSGKQISEEDDHYRQLRECAALDEIENLYWYDREIIKIYLRTGTYRAVEAETGIPWESIYKTIRKGCLKIKLKVA